MATASITVAQGTFGFFGHFDTLTNTARRSMPQYSAGTAGSVDATWTGYITGTEAKLACGGGGANPYLVSVDGGAETAPAISGAYITLFTGLTDAPHLVRIRCNTGYSPSFNWTATDPAAELLSVTGAAPAVGAGADLGPAWHITDPAAPLLHAASLDGGALGANIRPTHPPAASVTGAGGLIRARMLVFRAAASAAWLYTTATDVWVSVDGGAPVKQALVGVGGLALRHWKKFATPLDASAQHTYAVVEAGFGGAPTQGLMIGGAGAAFGTVPDRVRVDQWGDSISEGAAGDSGGVTDAYLAAIANGHIAASLGIGGLTTAALLAALPAAAARRAVKQHAVLAIGRNDPAGGAQFRADYLGCIDALLAAGYTKVVCRGITPLDGGTADFAATADIQAVVAAKADARVEFMPVSTWQPIATVLGEGGDTTGYAGTHPTAQGYAQSAVFYAPALKAIIDPAAPAAAAPVVAVVLLGNGMGMTIPAGELVQVI